MTNDEKAEKNIKEKLCFFCKEEKNKTKCATCPTFLTAYISYLDGLEEGKPKWHDLRKNPDDLPTKEDITIRCILRNGNEVICKTDWYEPMEDEIGYGKIIIQFYCNEDWIDTNDVLYWCELPKFEEK